MGRGKLWSKPTELCVRVPPGGDRIFRKPVRMVLFQSGFCTLFGRPKVHHRVCRPSPSGNVPPFFPKLLSSICWCFRLDLVIGGGRPLRIVAELRIWPRVWPLGHCENENLCRLSKSWVL